MRERRLECIAQRGAVGGGGASGGGHGSTGAEASVSHGGLARNCSKVVDGEIEGHMVQRDEQHHLTTRGYAR